MWMPATPARMNSRTERMVCSGSPKPAPPSATSGTVTAAATSPATRTCSSMVSSGSDVQREPPVTKPPEYTAGNPRLAISRPPIAS